MNRFAVVLFIAAAASMPAEEASVSVSSVAASSATMFRVPSRNILRAAEKMPEEYFTFRPSPDVRTFGEIVGHIADGYRLVCGVADGKPMPDDIRQNEKTKKARPELIAALKENAAYCEAVHDRLSGAAGAEVVDFFGTKHARVTLLFFNTSHAWEHYGNLVTYMRLKGVVPPSSEPRKQ